MYTCECSVVAFKSPSWSCDLRMPGRLRENRAGEDWRNLGFRDISETLTQASSQAQQPLHVLGVGRAPREVVGMVVVSSTPQHLQRQHA